MDMSPEQRLRFKSAFAIFEAQRELLAQGWDLETVQGLTWQVDVRPGDDGEGEVSAHFEFKSGGGSALPPGQEAKASDGGTVTNEPLSSPPHADAYRISVALRTGGTMTLSVSVNPSSLRGKDRTFFHDVVNTLSAYQ